MADTVWEKISAEEKEALFALAEDYRQFLSISKTERAFVKNSIELAEKAGFKPIEKVKKLKAGDRVYVNNRGKNLCLFVIGKKPVKDGMNILGAHIDSPRLDIKQKPLYEKDGIAFLDTHYYGAIKKYQWVAAPMALAGVVCKKDGTTVDINIGDNPGDPVVGISDLLIHLASNQMHKTAAEVIDGENLDITIGTIPSDAEKDKVKDTILGILKEKYGIEEDDFISAEIEAVPAGEARDYGLDRSMIIGYGHDDRICGYTSMRAILEMKKPDRTSCCILVDKEEIGSMGNTGMQSRFFEQAAVQLMGLQGELAPMDLYTCMSRSKMLSSDVSAAYDPLYPEVMETKNSSYFGKGISFNKYTGAYGKGGCSDANAEYVAQIRRVMDDNDVMFQTCEVGRVDAGGGGTIALYLANMNMDVIDAGIAVQNMHAPFEVASKADIYEAYRAYKAFLKDMK